MYYDLKLRFRTVFECCNEIFASKKIYLQILKKYYKKSIYIWKGVPALRPKLWFGIGMPGEQQNDMLRCVHTYGVAQIVLQVPKLYSSISEYNLFFRLLGTVCVFSRAT